MAIAVILRDPAPDNERIRGRVLRARGGKGVYTFFQVVIGRTIVDPLFLKSSCGHLPISSVATSLYHGVDTHFIRPPALHLATLATSTTKVFSVIPDVLSPEIVLYVYPGGIGTSSTSIYGGKGWLPLHDESWTAS
jgi:hypothetical protein